jgi:hypothetical protein
MRGSLVDVRAPSCPTTTVLAANTRRLFPDLSRP